MCALVCCEVVWREFVLLARVFGEKQSDQHDTFRTLVGKLHLVEHSLRLSRWQTGGTMEGRIRDCEIKPLQPGDLCQRALACQQHDMQKYQRKRRRRLPWLRVFTSAKSSIMRVRIYSWVCVCLAAFPPRTLHLRFLQPLYRRGI